MTGDGGFPCRQVFFCKYNDPIYVKMEKLEIMIKLASDRNIDQVGGIPEPNPTHVGGDNGVEIRAGEPGGKRHVAREAQFL